MKLLAVNHLGLSFSNDLQDDDDWQCNFCAGFGAYTAMDTAARALLVRDALNLFASQLSLDGPIIPSLSSMPHTGASAAAPAAAKSHAASSLLHRPQTGTPRHAADLLGSPGMSNGPARGPGMLADQQLHPLHQHSMDNTGLSAAAAQAPGSESTIRKGPASSRHLARPPHATDLRPEESSLNPAAQQGLPTPGSSSQESATRQPFLPPRPSRASVFQQSPPAASPALAGFNRNGQPSQAALPPSLTSTSRFAGPSPSMSLLPQQQQNQQQQQALVTPRPARLMVALQQRALTRRSKEEMLADASWAAQAEGPSGERCFCSTYLMPHWQMYCTKYCRGSPQITTS